MRTFSLRYIFLIPIKKGVHVHLLNYLNGKDYFENLLKIGPILKFV